jgi:plasmid stabilization system protein ParE
MAALRRAALWSPEALYDLNDIWDHYARVAGPPTADKLLRDIDGVVTTLEDHPFAGRARGEIRSGLHSFATARTSFSIVLSMTGPRSFACSTADAISTRYFLTTHDDRVLLVIKEGDQSAGFTPASAITLAHLAISALI